MPYGAKVIVHPDPAPNEMKLDRFDRNLASSIRWTFGRDVKASVRVDQGSCSVEGVDGRAKGAAPEKRTRHVRTRKTR